MALAATVSKMAAMTILVRDFFMRSTVHFPPGNVNGDSRRDGLVLPQVAAHRCVFIGMLALPPLQVMQVTAKGERGSFYSGNGNAIVDRVAAFRASAGLNELRRYGAMPGNSSVAA